MQIKAKGRTNPCMVLYCLYIYICMYVCMYVYFFCTYFLFIVNEVLVQVLNNLGISSSFKVESSSRFKTPIFEFSFVETNI